MREQLEKMAVAGKIEGRHVEPLLQMTTSGYCMHRSWGFGKIKTVETVFARFTIDFPSKPGHTMDLGFAAESLKPIPKEHILARKAADLEGLRQMAALQHLDLIKMVLNSYGGKATVDQMQQVLVPDVIRDDWKNWWETAKREMKKDGHFQVPIKKTEPVIYQVQEVSLQDRLLEEFRAAKGLNARVPVALDDGTMVVVENGRKFMGKNSDVTVTSVLQTTAGRMIFSELRGRKSTDYASNSDR